MKSITYLKGDATAPHAAGNKIICHICNDIGGWGKGFVVAISERWPQPEQAYREWYRNRDSDDFGLGAVQLLQVEPDNWVANRIGRQGITGRTEKPIRYESVEIALERVADNAAKLSASLHNPRIGCGLADGTWDPIEPIVMRILRANETNACVYDFESR